jgi:hypothetical protein
MRMIKSLRIKQNWVANCQHVSCHRFESAKFVFDSSNAVLGMAFTHTPLKKVIAICTALDKLCTA